MHAAPVDATHGLVALVSAGPCKPIEVRVTVDSAALTGGHTEAGERCDVDRVSPMPVTTARALFDDASVAVLVRDGDDITARVLAEADDPGEVAPRARGSVPHTTTRSRRISVGGSSATPASGISCHRTTLIRRALRLLRRVVRDRTR
jgi:hypothetical protein